jgi:hypothetical protein
MKCRTLGVALMLTGASTHLLAAQRHVSVNIAGGVSLPQGDLADRVSMGWHGLAMLDLTSPMLPQGLRLDVAYNRFGFDDAVGAGNQTVMSGTLNFTYRVPAYNSPLSPYLIAGLGAYRVDCSQSAGCGAATRYGWNFGLGTKLYVLGLRSFLETRYHLTKFHGTPVHYFPVTFGVSF